MADRILMVVTSCDHIDAEHPTGVWFEEFAVPYMAFCQAQLDVTVASPRGGKTPVDPRSLAGEDQGRWSTALKALHGTVPLEEISAGPYEAIFLPGGHGTMFDLPENLRLQRLLLAMNAGGKPIAAVCHGPCALVGVCLADGRPLVAGRRLTAFTDAEEREVHFERLMPFLLEERLRSLGADFVAAPNWSDHVESDGLLITGQNPQSSLSCAQALLRNLARPA